MVSVTQRQRQDLPLAWKVHEGHKYNLSNNTSPYYVYVKCASEFCKGTAKIHRQTEVFTILRQHNLSCIPGEDTLNIIQFKRSMKESLQNHWWALKQCYDTFAVIYPEAANHVPYHAITTTMRKWRSIAYPSTPTTMIEFSTRINLLRAETWDYPGGRMSFQVVTSDENNVHIVFFDEEFIRRQNEIESFTKIFADGTFDTRAALDDCLQLLTVSTVMYDHVIPILYALMSRQTEGAYIACLAPLRRLINPDTVDVTMSDYEGALRGALHRIFPEAFIAGCNVHFDRAVLRKVNGLGLSNYVKNHPEAQLFIRRVLTLPFEPSERISPRFELFRSQLTPSAQGRMTQFVNYFRTFWLQRITPAGFCIYGLSRRDNNCSEALNSTFERIVPRHPTPWQFTEKLMVIQGNAVRDVGHLSAGRQVRRQPRYACKVRQEVLIKAWRQKYCGMISDNEFTEIMMNIKGPINVYLERLPPSDEAPNVGQLYYHQNNRVDPDFEIIVVQNPLPQEAQSLRRSIRIQDIQLPEVQQDLNANDEPENQIAPRDPEDEQIVVAEVHAEPAGRSPRVEPLVAVLNQNSASNNQVEDNDLDLIEVAPADIMAQIPAVGQAVTQALARNPHRKRLRHNQKNRRSQNNNQTAEQRQVAVQQQQVEVQQQQQQQVAGFHHQNPAVAHQQQNVNVVGGCMVCFFGPSSHAVVPCGHQCVCVNCGGILWEQNNPRCPICMRAMLCPPLRIWIVNHGN